MNDDTGDSIREAIDPDFYPLQKTCILLYSVEFRKSYLEDRHDKKRREIIEELDRLLDEEDYY